MNFWGSIVSYTSRRIYSDDTMVGVQSTPSTKATERSLGYMQVAPPAENAETRVRALYLTFCEADGEQESTPVYLLLRCLRPYRWRRGGPQPQSKGECEVSLRNNIRPRAILHLPRGDASLIAHPTRSHQSCS